MPSSSLIPSGFEPLASASPLVSDIGPVYCRDDGNAFEIGFHVEAHHMGERGCHEAVLSCVAHVLIDAAVERRVGTAGVPPMLSLSTTFMGVAPLGAWVRGRVEVSQTSTELIFAKARLYSGVTMVLSANGMLRRAD